MDYDHGPGFTINDLKEAMAQEFESGWKAGWKPEEIQEYFNSKITEGFKQNNHRKLNQYVDLGAQKHYFSGIDTDEIKLKLMEMSEDCKCTTYDWKVKGSVGTAVEHCMAVETVLNNMGISDYRIDLSRKSNFTSLRMNICGRKIRYSWKDQSKPYSSTSNVKVV